uniref:Uncharacterized protein n=1 Tax=viral metagenome TaxID=1070528 RepID=A0A6C0ES74_9ZZZZ
MFNNKTLNDIQEKFFNVFIYTSYALIIISTLGLSQKAPQYLYDLDYYVRIYVCLFLMWRFNPFVHVSFTELDRKIAFSGGVFILTTTVLNTYISYIGNIIKHIVRPFITNHPF